MTWLRTIVSGAALVAMLLLMYVDGKLREARIIRGVNTASLAAGVNKSDVREIKIRNRYGEAELVRTGTDEWRLKKPVDAPADTEGNENVFGS